MSIERVRFAVAFLAVTVLSHASASRAFADALGCERAIAQASAKYVQGRAKILYKCEDAKANNKIRDTIVCATDPLFQPQRLAVSTRLYATVNLGCGGPNQDCGDGDDQPLGPAGWGIGQCPDLANAGCTNAITNCIHVAQCLECTGNAAVSQALDLTYGEFESSEFGTNDTVNRCQRAIGKSVAKYLASRAKALGRCWDARLLGRHSNPCPVPGDGQAALRIAKAEDKKQKSICKACGGADGTCDGSGDVTPSAVGFATSCPAVDTFTPPSSCGGAIVDAASIVGCVDCVSDHDVDCASDESVPGIVGPPPAACNPATTTTTTSTIAPSTSTSATSPATTSSSSSTTVASTTTLASTTSTSTLVASTSTSTSTIGSTTSSSTTSTPASTTTSTTASGGGFDFLSTSGSGNCGNTFRDGAATVVLKNLLCGNLSLGGGLSQVPDNSTPSGATNRFTLSGCVGTTCNIGPTTSGSTPAGVDCTDVGCRFGVPLPISNAGLSVCVTNTFSPVPPSGTLDTSSGAATWNFQLNSATVLTGNPAQPCPICATSVGGSACAGSPGSPCTGVCDGSPNQGSSCQSKNPQGLSSDCPAPAASTGVQKCYRGTNNGATCSTGGDCPGGLCAQFIGNIAISLNPLTTGTSSLTSLNAASCTGAGAPYACCTGVGTGNCTGDFCAPQATTAHGAFNTAICFSGVNSGKPCVNITTTAGNDVANCGAANPTCRPGNLVNYCSGGANDGLGCSSAATCPSPGTCVRAGTLAQLIREVGVPAGGLTVGVPKAIKLGSAFCVAATTNPTVNANANLPAAGATSVVGTVTLLP